MKTLLLILYTVLVPAAMAQSCEPEVTINLAFKYDSPHELPATAKDIEVFQKRASGGRVVNLFLDKSASKEQIIAKIKEAMGSAKNVRFNYAGHGIVTKGSAKIPGAAELMKEAKAYRSPEPIRPAKKSTSKTGWVAPYGEADNVPSVEDRPSDPRPKGGKFALSPPACQTCLQTAKNACIKRLGGQVSHKV